METNIGTDIGLDIDEAIETIPFELTENAGFIEERSLSDFDSSSIDEECLFLGTNNPDDTLEDLDKDELDAIENDQVYKEIQDFVDQTKHGPKPESSITNSDESPHVKTSLHFSSLPYGPVLRTSYEHGNMCSDIMGVTYNERMRQFIILDAKGITTWKRDAVSHRVDRVLEYPKYEYRVITQVVYAKKFNCYFGLGKDFSLKVFNRDFIETCSVSADLRSVLFMLFNPLRDELITGGVGGTKVWKFQQQAEKSFGSLRPLANYGLSLKYELPNVGGGWVKRVEMDYNLEQLYCCSDTGLHVYDLDGKQLLTFERAHTMTITGCRYSRTACVLVTSSLDTEVKVWSLMGGLVHTFRGHSRAVTSLLLHPYNSSIVVTCSLDGSLHMWSLDTMESIYSLVVSVDGILWMGLTDDNLLYMSTPRTLTLWNFNYNIMFWALARSQVNSLSLCRRKGKTTRLMVVTEDSSVRLMARSNRKNLCTVLPPPSISPLQKVLSVCYDREHNTIYMLVNPAEVWVYTTRTDPSCRVAVWNVIEIQSNILASRVTGAGDFNPSRMTLSKSGPVKRATENVAGNVQPSNCCCLAVLNSPVVMWTDQGSVLTSQDIFLLLGLEDGRILFMDPVVKGQRYLEFKTGKDAVLDISHDTSHDCLNTLYKPKGVMLVHIWSLPNLTMLHEVFTAPDLGGYARLGNYLMTGYYSGHIIFHSMEPATDLGLNKPKTIPAVEELLDEQHKPEHLAAVIAVDVCPAVKIFCSCSTDGAIKIWDENTALLTEVMLDTSLSAACFLNNMGDLVVGFQKHLFYIDHSKLCSQLSIPESDVDSFDKESMIYEDPAVVYEGVAPYPDPISLDNYLIPYDIEFSKDFLEGKIQIIPEVLKKQEPLPESRCSMAPTEIYSSPDSTPRRRLSLVDHMLDYKVSSYELLLHMKKTLDQLAEREKKDARQLIHEQKKAKESRSTVLKRKLRMHLASENKAKSTRDKRKNKIEEPIRFSFPKFGKSPGPTPEPSNPPTPDLLDDSEEVEKSSAWKEETTTHKAEDLKFEDDEISRFLRKEKEKEEKKKVEATDPQPTVARKKFGFSGVTVDAQSLIKEAKSLARSTAQGGAAKRYVETGQAKKVEPEPAVAEKKVRQERVVKKKVLTRVVKPPKPKETKESIEAAPTLMQALEMKELQLNLDEETSEITTQETNAAEEDGTVVEDDKVIPESPQPVDEENNIPADSSLPLSFIPKTDNSVQLLVPDLPPLPDLNQNMPAVPKLSAAESKAAMLKKLDRRTAIDFGGASKLPGTNNNKLADSWLDDDTQAPMPGMSTQIQTRRASGMAENKNYQAEKSGQERISDLPDKTSQNEVKTSGYSERISADVHENRQGVRSRIQSRELQPSEVKRLNEKRLSHRGSRGSVDSVMFMPDTLAVPGHAERRRSGEPGVNEYEQGPQLGQQHTAQDDYRDLLTPGEVTQARARPYTSAEEGQGKFTGRTTAMSPLQKRPYTVQAGYQTELELIMKLPSSQRDLQLLFENSLYNFKLMSRSNMAGDKLYKNEDQSFSDHWHERKIERHMLLKMQKELRTLNVQKKRLVLEQEKQARIKQHIMEGTRAGHVTPRETPHAGPNLYTRASTVHGSRPTLSIPVPTPVSSRPHTATGGPETHPPQPLQVQVKPHPPPMSLQQQIEKALEFRARQQEVEASLRGKQELGHKKSFRCRLRQSNDKKLNAPDISPDIDPWQIDPRNPHAMRPKSSKSIPSKCHQYVLVTRPKTQLDLPMPTPLEEQLLALRFPDQGEKVFRQYEGLLFRPPHRPVYGIQYSPFEHQLYG
ncbi:uncharacterized protein LOC131931960 [Physella acuta]|uniref:uncharacterized protein LOC131931960 n=1 Tax=Physella acuta TaxID=109671 RepID=UPI0027DB4CF5|nr:uncharacterized protein LOC131931960 [Physella acuta]